MRTEDTTLTAAQLAGGDALCKLVLSGATTETYSESSTNRILDLRHSEEEWSQTAQVVVDNRDGNLTAEVLQGYKGVISYGYHTAGESPEDEYSASAPLTVIAQKTDRMQGELVTSFSLAGLFNMFGEDKANAAYTPDDDNTDTVKTILDDVASNDLACFDHCEAHTITYDTGYDDGIIDTFIPADYFSVGLNESRLSVFKKLLRLTRCKARVENDSGTATIHIFLPNPYANDWASGDYSLTDRVRPTTPNGFEYICTTAGTSGGTEPATWNVTEGSTTADSGVTWTIVWYDYEYNDAVTGHNFFDKSVRKRLVIPNKVTVSNHPDHEDSYTGTATDVASRAALGFYLPIFKYTRPISDAQALLIATAILQGYQLAREKGHGHAMMNVYQEVMDYVLITDSWASDTRVGNIGSLVRHYRPGVFDFEFRFGSLALEGLAGTITPSTPVVTQVTRERPPPYTQMLIDEMERLGYIINDLMALTNGILEYLAAKDEFGEVIPKLHVTGQLIIPVE